MFAGEYNFRVWYGRDVDVKVLQKSMDESPYHAKAQIVLAQIMSVAFVFLFGVVVMNLLNAFAIGDIQVRHINKNHITIS